jgi:hypothetical protein
VRYGQARIRIKIRSQMFGSGSDQKRSTYDRIQICNTAERHHFYAGLAPGKDFDAAAAPVTPAPTLLYTVPVAGQLFKNKVNQGLRLLFHLIFEWLKWLKMWMGIVKICYSFRHFIIGHLRWTLGLEPEPSEPEMHLVAALAPPKWCGSLRLRLRNTAYKGPCFHSFYIYSELCTNVYKTKNKRLCLILFHEGMCLQNHLLKKVNA